MLSEPSRIAQRTGLRGVRRTFNKPNHCVAIEVPERARDARQGRERAVKEWESLDLAAIYPERSVNWIDPVEREFLEHGFEADVADLVRQPVC
jgi:hypothetical protein